MLNNCLAILAGSALFVAAPAWSGELAQPSGDVILTVTGAIDVTNDGDAAVFDMEMLEAMGPETFDTSTIWTEGVHSYTGVPLHRLLEELGVEDGVLRATAINDYSVDVPVSDAVPGGPILAYLRDDAPMSVRDQGPLWLIYPYDDRDDYRTEVIYSRSIWQLDRLVVVE